MNKTILFVLPLSFVLASCVTPQMDGPPVCESYTMPSTCSGDPQAPTVNLNTNTLNANPSCVEAAAGTTLVFKLTPMGGKNRGAVEIFPKDEADTWLAATNNGNGDFIFIPVPANLSPGDHDYGIRTDSKCVDPRVRVR